MDELVYTLVGEGPTDRRLLAPVDWLFGQLTERPFRGQWADNRVLPTAGGGLAPKLAAALENFPCDLLLIHRDSDSRDHKPRVCEIDEAAEVVGVERYVRVIPVQMQEAWFLFDEAAIRSAVGKPSQRNDLNLPAPRNLEAIADPKDRLNQALRDAAALTGRRRKRFSLPHAANLVAERICDFSPLRGVASFRRLEKELGHALTELERDASQEMGKGGMKHT